MSFDSGNDLELYAHAELALQTQSRGSSREATAERSADASRVLADGLARPRLERLWAVRCDRVSCWSSGELVRPRLRVGYVMRCL